MLSEKLGHRLDPFLKSIFKIFFGEKGNPNLFTMLGFFATIIASFLLLRDLWFFAGIFFVISGLFDLFDGMLARTKGKVTLFGSFLDSVLDRYSDLLFLLALLIYYLKKGTSDLAILTSFVSIGTALIPYVRAKAEALQISCHIGLMERAERIILLSIGMLLDLMAPILWIMAILTHITVLQRIYHVSKRLRNNDKHRY